jgi:hypothetical protein
MFKPQKSSMHKLQLGTGTMCIAIWDLFGVWKFGVWDFIADDPANLS